jgi:hypothetical protein
VVSGPPTVRTPDELRHHLDAIDAPVTYVWVEGRADWKGRDEQVASAVAAWLKGARCRRCSRSRRVRGR